jgi:small subunit ribosomal protein S14
MAKTSAIQRNLKVIRLVNKFSKKRKKLKKIIKNRKLPLDERFNAQLKLAKLPRNSAKIRIRNRCEMTGGLVEYIENLRSLELHLEN